MPHTLPPSFSADRRAGDVLCRASTVLAAFMAGFLCLSPLAHAAEKAAPAQPTAASGVPVTPVPELNDEAQRIYQKHGDAIYQIQVIDLASDKKATIGSGFQFTADGLIATNYHVIAEALQRPDNNRLEYIHDKHGKGGLTVLIADVMYDLAILKMETPGTNFVELGQSKLPKGTRLFSLGNPHDIGFTIVEGTYNGLSRESFIDKIHFSGAINPGMSGGPVLGHDGRVVGINVATAGNQIGFLVPVEPLRNLLKKYLAQNEDYNFAAAADADIQEQLRAGQADNIKRLMAEDWESMTFGPVMVPGRINDAFKCWGGPEHKDKDPFTHFRTNCSTEHNVFLDNRFNTGTFSYSYDLLRAKDELNAVRFYNLYEQLYTAPMGMGLYYNAREQDVTNFDCSSDFLDLADHRWKASLCIRRYKKYPDIHDLHLYMALLGDTRSGMVVSFVAQGVARDSGLELVRKFMAQLKPVPPQAQEPAPIPPENTPAPAKQTPATPDTTEGAE